MPVRPTSATRARPALSATMLLVLLATVVAAPSASGAEAEDVVLPTLVEALAVTPHVRVVSSTVNVRPLDAPTGTAGATLRAVRNELESFQIVVSGQGGALSNLDVTPGALSGPGGATIPASNVRVHRMDYVNLHVASDHEGAPGRWGDPLIPERDVVFGEDRAAFPLATVPAGENRVAWVDVQVPVGAAAGTYSGSVTVSTGQGTKHVPVSVEVLGHTLPSTSRLTSLFKIGFPDGGWSICQAHTGTNTCGTAALNWSLHARYGLMALNNRVTVPDPWPYALSPTGPVDGTANETNFETHVLPLITGSAGTVLAGARLTNVTPVAYGSLAVGDRCKVDCMAAWKAAAQSHGFLDRLGYYACDEPGGNTAEWTACTTRANDVNATDPRVDALVTSNISQLQGNAGAAAAHDTVVPVINHMHGRNDGDQRSTYDAYLADSTKSLWLYTSCMSFGCWTDDINVNRDDGWPGYAIDAPANQHRAMGWMVQRYDATGHLYWHAVQKLHRAWNDCAVDNGNCIYDSGGNGDGTLFYPGKPCAPGADRACIGGTNHVPVESVRLKRTRDGHEDHDLMAWLRDEGHGAEVDALVNAIYPTAYSATAAKDGPSATPGDVPDTLDEARDQLMDLVAAAAGPPPPVTDAEIAFTSNRDGNDEIYTMKADGTSQTRLTTHASLDHHPSWSPDGSRLAFTSERTGNREIWVMDADGANQQRITNHAAVDEKPVWSPDGGRLAFVSTRAGNPDIWIADLDGNLLRVTTDPGNDHDPTWTPDGNAIVFASNRAGAAGVDLYLVPADASAAPTRLTTAAGAEDNPDVSPDGLSLAYNGDTTGDYEVFSQPLSGGTPTNLTSSPATAEVYPAWSPDGSQVVYSSSTGGDHELYVMNTDGTSPTALTDNAAADTWADWKPAMPTAPVNDDFPGLDLDAFPSADRDLDGEEEIEVSGTFAGATVQAGEPASASIAPTATVWFEWTAPATGNWTVSNPGQTVDTVIGVYTGSAVDALTPVAANDDNGDGMPWSLATFTAAAGTTYRIVLDNRYGGDHGYTLVVEPTPADTTAPQTTITSGPSGTVRSSAASFAFSSSESGSTFQCRLDAGAWSACASPKEYSGLVDGPHTFSVRARDAAGNVDPTPATRTWTIDTTPPNTTITSGPSDSSNQAASFAFTATETSATFQCQLDGGSWTSCTSPRTYTSLSEGTHTFRVRARDALGNTDSSPASRTWTIELADEPDPSPTATDTPTFRDDEDSIFEQDIERLAASGITKGCNPPTNDRFCPTDPVTRGQMAAFLVRGMGFPTAPLGRFVDARGHVFEADIAALARAGVTKGCNPPTNDRFCPDEDVTRGQMAAFLVRALDLPPAPVGRFADARGHLFEADIAALARAGITMGCNPPTNDRFCPDEDVTREQMAAFLVRAGLTDSRGD